jgi:hypothetical protein
VWQNAAFITDNFIPLVLNGDCTRQEMVAAFMKRLKGHFANEMAVATANGKFLSGDLAGGLKKWKELPKQQRSQLDNLGVYDPKRDPAPPEGGLVLKVFARPLQRDKPGSQLRIYRNEKAHLSKEPGRDHLWMTATEAKSLLPAKLQRGASKAVPPALVDRLCRRYLIDLVRIGGEGGPRRREDVVSQQLTMTVEEVAEQHVRLRLEGSAVYKTRGRENGVPLGERRDTFDVRGVVEVNRISGQFRRFDAVALCETGHFDEIGRKLMPLGIAFELTAAKKPIDRVRPHSFYREYFGRK